MNYKLFLNSLLGKFIILGITWSFSFQILSEIRHLIMDLVMDLNLKQQNNRLNCYIWINNFNCYFLLIGKILFKMINATKKWIFLKLVEQYYSIDVVVYY